MFVLVVLSLPSRVAPARALVHTFAPGERTVAAWRQRAGQDCQGYTHTPLLTAALQQARDCARAWAILVCVDGLAASVTACLRVFRRE